MRLRKVTEFVYGPRSNAIQGWQVCLPHASTVQLRAMFPRLPATVTSPTTTPGTGCSLTVTRVGVPFGRRCGMFSGIQPLVRSRHSPPRTPVIEYGPGYDGWLVVTEKLNVFERRESSDPALICLQTLTFPPNASPAPTVSIATVARASSTPMRRDALFAFPMSSPFGSGGREQARGGAPILGGRRSPAKRRGHDLSAPSDNPVVSSQTIGTLELDGHPGAVLRPLEPADAAKLRRMRTLPEVHRWWGDEQEADWPFEDDPETTKLAIVVDGEVAGLIQFWEEPDERYRHAGIDIFLAPDCHGRGLGTAAVHRLARHLIEERGHHRLTIDPAAENAAAIRAYEKAGFRPVGVMRRYERNFEGDGWHDSLLMDLLAEELR